MCEHSVKVPNVLFITSLCDHRITNTERHRGSGWEFSDRWPSCFPASRPRLTHTSTISVSNYTNNFEFIVTTVDIYVGIYDDFVYVNCLMGVVVTCTCGGKHPSLGGLRKVIDTLEQTWALYGPRATSGPLAILAQPAWGNSRIKSQSQIGVIRCRQYNCTAFIFKATALFPDNETT